MSEIAVIPDTSSANNANKRARSSSVSKQGRQAQKNPRKSSSLPSETVEYLKAWMMSPEHVAHPYPTEQEKAQIMADTGIELKQLTNWFVNNRKRYWKPRVEARLQQQAQVQGPAATTATTTGSAVVVGGPSVVPLSSSTMSKASVTNSVEKRRQPRQQRQSPVPTHRVVVNTADISALISSAETHPVSETSSSGSIGSEDNDQVSLSNDSFEESGNNNCITYHKDEIRHPTKHRRVSIDEDDKTFKRMRLSHYNQQLQQDRTKYHQKSLSLWREACLKATHIYDDELPSIEEAAHLFGYHQQAASVQ